MPFTFRNLGCLNYANGFTQFHYKSPSSLAEVASPGYFSDARDMLAPGDVIIVSAPDGTAFFYVTNAQGDVAAVGMPRMAEASPGKLAA